MSGQKIHERHDISCYSTALVMFSLTKTKIYIHEKQRTIKRVAKSQTEFYQLLKFVKIREFLRILKLIEKL